MPFKFLDTGITNIVNLNEKEKIRSVFLNNLNNSIVIVSVRDRTSGGSSKMKCRSMPIKALLDSGNRMKEQSIKLFRCFILRWPDFIEFDELNGKIVTKHTEEQTYRVWSLETYNLVYSITNPNMSEFKIW
jgi:hypothetical protein